VSEAHPQAEDRVTYVGHATALLELGGVRVLTDPVLRRHIGYLRRQSATPAATVGERLDVVLISHLHLDHLDLPSLRGIGHDVHLLVPRGIGPVLRRKGFRRVTEPVAGDGVRIGEEEAAEVVAVPAVHDGSRRPFGGPRAEPIGFEVRGTRRVYFAGDTDLYDEMTELAGDLDLALLPVWGWGPRLGAGHLDPAGAARAAALLRPRLAIPIHWGTLFPIGLARYGRELLERPPRDFAAAVASLAPEVQVTVLDPGQALSLSASVTRR